MRYLTICQWMVAAALVPASILSEDKLAVCATTPDLGALIREVGGDAVELTVLAKGPEDPHYLEPRPSFIVTLHDADLFAVTGAELEIGWAPLLVKRARNSSIIPGGTGHFDASSAVELIGKPAPGADRSAGDLHALGNPHFLLDPINGWRVARAIARKLAELRPARASDFDTRLGDFERRLVARLFGAAIAAANGERSADVLRLVDLGGVAKAAEVLGKQGEAGTAGAAEATEGWIGALASLRSRSFIADHQLWEYFAARFDLKVAGYMEPKPGIAPSTRHIAALAEQMKREKIELIGSSPYFDTAHARILARATGARVAELAHQPGSRVGTESYLEMIDHNVREFAGR